MIIILVHPLNQKKFVNKVYQYVFVVLFLSKVTNIQRELCTNFENSSMNLLIFIFLHIEQAYINWQRRLIKSFVVEVQDGRIRPKLSSLGKHSGATCLFHDISLKRYKSLSFQGFALCRGKRYITRSTKRMTSNTNPCIFIYFHKIIGQLNHVIRSNSKNK